MYNSEISINCYWSVLSRRSKYGIHWMFSKNITMFKLQWASAYSTLLQRISLVLCATWRNLWNRWDSSIYCTLKLQSNTWIKPIFKYIVKIFFNVLRTNISTCPLSLSSSVKQGQSSLEVTELPDFTPEVCCANCSAAQI